MKILLFKKEFIPKIMKGTKTQTRRLESKLKEGDIVFAKISYYTHHFAKLKIIKIWQERLGDISNEDVKEEGFCSHFNFMKRLCEINKGKEITKDTILTAIKFERIKKS